MSDPIIKVRAAGNGYTATCNGKRASCTWSHEQAAKSVAQKCYGEKAGVAPDYLQDGDVAAGTQYRYHVTHNH